MEPLETTVEVLRRDGWRERALPGYAGLIGPIWTRKEDDAWAYGLVATAAHLNPAGIVHGGALTSLIDHALSAIAWEAVQRRPCVTVQLDTQFLSAARQGQFLVARGTVMRTASALVFVRGTISAGNVDVVAASAVLTVLRDGKSVRSESSPA